MRSNDNIQSALERLLIRKPIATWLPLRHPLPFARERVLSMCVKAKFNIIVQIETDMHVSSREKIVDAARPHTVSRWYVDHLQYYIPSSPLL